MLFIAAIEGHGPCRSEWLGLDDAHVPMLVVSVDTVP
jgi:hypothetical protein